MKLKKIITFRVSALREIELKSIAENRGVSLSGFIHYCIDKEVENSKKERKEEKEKQDKDKRLHDFDRLIETLLEINRTVYQSIESVEGLREDIGLAMSAAFPEKRIFFNKIFSKLL